MEFSKEDADFVRTYAKSTVFGESEAATLARKSEYFNKGGGGSGISATMNGYVWDDIGIINHSFGAYFSTKINSGQAKKLQILLQLLHMVLWEKVGSERYIVIR